MLLTTVVNLNIIAGQATAGTPRTVHDKPFPVHNTHRHHTPLCLAKMRLKVVEKWLRHDNIVILNLETSCSFGFSLKRKMWLILAFHSPASLGLG